MKNKTSKKKRKAQYPCYINFRIEKEQREAIEQMAREANQSISETARELVLLSRLNRM